MLTRTGSETRLDVYGSLFQSRRLVDRLRSLAGIAALQERSIKHFLILIAFFAVFGGLADRKVSSAPFGYDESDYMYAAKLGPLAHWLDVNSMPTTDYLRVGLRGRARDPKQRLALSQLSRAGSDPNTYRHSHGPLYWYWLGAVSSLDRSEGVLRWLSLLFPAITAILLYFGALRILPNPFNQIAAIVSCALFLWSPFILETTELAPHLAFVFCYVAALLFLAKVMSGGTRRQWYAALIATGTAFCTLEVAVVLIPVCAICAWRRRKALAADLRFIGASLAVFIATVLVIWPAGLFKLTFAKAYLFDAYLALSRKAAWSSLSFVDAWAHRFALSPLEWILIAIGLVLLVRLRHRPVARALEPFVWFAALMLVFTLSVKSFIPRYSTVFLPALGVISAWTIAASLGSLKRHTRYLITTAIVVSLAITNAWKLSAYRAVSNPRVEEALRTIHSYGLDNKLILVPQGFLPQLHYYLPHAQILGYIDAPDPAQTRAVHPDAVLYIGKTMDIELKTEKSKQE